MPVASPEVIGSPVLTSANVRTADPRPSVASVQASANGASVRTVTGRVARPEPNAVAPQFAITFSGFPPGTDILWVSVRGPADVTPTIVNQRFRVPQSPTELPYGAGIWRAGPYQYVFSADGVSYEVLLALGEPAAASAPVPSAPPGAVAQPSPAATTPAGATTAPAPAATTPPTVVPPTATPRPALVFTFGPEVSARDAADIRDGVARMRAYLAGTMRGDAVTSVTVLASLPGSAVPLPPMPAACCTFNPATSVISLNVADRAWLATSYQAGIYYHPKIVSHEYFHAWQSALGCIGGKGPTTGWLLEGGAEFYAYRSHIASGLLSTAGVHEGEVGAVRPGQTLQSQEQDVPSAEGLPYLAIERLVARSGESSYRAFCAAVGAGTAWQVAMASAFGISAQDFYADFGRWQAAGFP